MKTIATLLFGVNFLVMPLGYAQESMDLQVDEEFNRVYDKYQTTSPNGANIVATPAAELPRSAEVPQSYGSQPPVNVTGTPLNESRADQLRRSRQNMEVQTEQKIVEQLESARMDAEKQRADEAAKLFNKKEEAKPVVVPPPAPVAPAEPVRVVIETPPPAPPAKSEEVQTVRDEIRDISNELKAHVEAEDTPPPINYIHAIIGLSEYENIKNVRGNYSVGIGFGTEVRERVIAEGSFIYSSYDIERVDREWPQIYRPDYHLTGVFQELNQYNFQGAIKYQILDGRIRPNVGALASYVYRKYGNIKYPNSYYRLGYNPYGSYYYPNAYSNFEYGEIKSSHAIDLGLLLGVDVTMTDGFAIGVDVRYMTNLYNRLETAQPVSITRGPQGSIIEDKSYYQFGLSGQFTF